MRLADKLHAGLCGCAAAFALIAGFARGDDVFPALFPALHDWNDVIKGEMGFVEAISAVLTGVLIAKKNVRAREADDVFLFRERYVVEKPEYRGDFDRQSHGVDFVLGLFNDFHLSLEQQLNRSLPGNDV